MFFATEPSQAVLSDTNGDLIASWVQVRENPEELLAAIRVLPVDSETYYGLRADNPDTEIGRAVRLIYLNRCCYGGLYRTNRKGAFNVPFGGGSRTPASLWERDQLMNASRALRSGDIILRQADFADAVGEAQRGDVCFLDPTYTAIQRGPFDRYNPKLFTWDDQIRLNQAAVAAAARGAIIVISNVDCDEVRELYAQQLKISLSRSKAIGNAIRNSRAQHELMIVYDGPEWNEIWIAAASQEMPLAISAQVGDHDFLHRCRGAPM